MVPEYTLIPEYPSNPHPPTLVTLHQPILLPYANSYWCSLSARTSVDRWFPNTRRIHTPTLVTLPQPILLPYATLRQPILVFSERTHGTSVDRFPNTRRIGGYRIRIESTAPTLATVPQPILVPYANPYWCTLSARWSVDLEHTLPCTSWLPNTVFWGLYV